MESGMDEETIYFGAYWVSLWLILLGLRPTNSISVNNSKKNIYNGQREREHDNYDMMQAILN